MYGLRISAVKTMLDLVVMNQLAIMTDAGVWRGWWKYVFNDWWLGS